MLHSKSSGAKCETRLQENNIGKCIKWRGRLVQPARSECVRAHQQICKVFPQQLPLPGSVLGVKDGGKSWFPKVPVVVYYYLPAPLPRLELGTWPGGSIRNIDCCERVGAGKRSACSSSSRCHLGAPAIALWSCVQLLGPDSASVQPTLPCKDTIVRPQTMYSALIVLRHWRGVYIFSVLPQSLALAKFWTYVERWRSVINFTSTCNSDC